VLLTSLMVNASPVIEQWQTSMGARVFFVEAPELPMIDIKIVFDAGSARDGDNFGIAQFTNGMLEEGAGELDVEQIAKGLMIWEHVFPVVLPVIWRPCRCAV